MRSLFTNSLFFIVMCSSALLSGIAYYFIWQHLLIGLSRPHMFILSWALLLSAGVMGTFFEDRLIWKGLFVTAREKRTIYHGRNGPVLTPITLGVASGIMSFMWWS